MGKVSDIGEGDTASGTSYGAKSTSKQYRHAHTVWKSVQTSICLTKHKLFSKDLYLPGETDDYVNRGLARLFVRYYVQTQGRVGPHAGGFLLGAVTI
jgi:hypothetical protein